MDEQVQAGNIEAILHKISGKRDQIVNYDVDLKKWKIKALYKDTLWVKRLDEPVSEMVMKGLLIVPSAKLRGVFSICEVLMTGPDVKTAKVGDFVLVPSGAMGGSDAMRIMGGYKTHYVPEGHVMSVVEYEGTVEEARQDIKDNIIENN